MSEKTDSTTIAGNFNHRQRLFNRYIVFILIDLAVLGSFNQYWDFVYIETFTVALLTAVLLQFLVQVTIKAEQHTAIFFETKMGIKNKAFRAFSAWAIMFVSKLVILELINLSFGDSVDFSGPLSGLVSFIVVVTVMIIIEQLVIKIHKSLGDKDINANEQK
jgi:hypothetical protein